MQKVDFRGFLCISATYYSYVSVCMRVLLVCISVCSPFVSVCCPFVITRMFSVFVRMFFVCCPYVITCMYPCVSVRRWCVTQCMLPVCARVLF